MLAGPRKCEGGDAPTRMGGVKRVVWIGLVLAACAGAEDGEDPRDAGARDVGVTGARDGGPKDAGAHDARDGGARDGGTRDAGPRDAGARDAGPAPEVGTATAVDVCTPNPNLPSASCEVVQIQTDGNPTIFVRLHIARSVRRERGVVIFGSGTGGGGAYFDGSVGTNRLRDALLADGFVIVERQWDGPSGGWFSGDTDQGLSGRSARYATLVEYVHTTHRSAADVPLCVTGNSGGAAEIGYALGAWQIDRWVDVAIPTSGPIDDLRDACWGDTERPDYFMSCDAEWDDRVDDGLTICSGRRSCQVNAEALVNATFVGEPCGPTGPPSPADLARLEADSPHRGRRPTCAVRVLVGEGDCGGVVPQGTRWADRLASDGADATWRFVAGARHGLMNVEAGAEAIRDVLIAECGE